MYSVVEAAGEKEWESFVSRHAPRALFQTWLWGETEKARGIAIGRYMVSGPAGIGAAFQFFRVDAKRGRFLHVRQGPVFADLADRRIWECILSFLSDRARQERAWFVRLGPQIPRTDSSQALLASFGMKPAAIHHMDAELCWVLLLDRDEDQLLSHMRKTTRYEIRRSQSQGVRIEKSTQVSDLSVFFDLYEKTSKRHHFVPHQGITEEFRTFAGRNQATLYTARYQKKVYAAAIILYTKEQAIYHHGASIPSPVSVTHLLQWEAIKEAKKRGMKVYNFWGIAQEDDKNHPWRGITVFKKGFGGHEVSSIHAHDLPVSGWYRLSRFVETGRRIRRGY